MQNTSENKQEYLFIYERSRFRSAAWGVVICSLLVGALGVFTWPIIRDMRSTWVDMFQSAAWVLAVIALLSALVWLYFILRMFVSGIRYLRGLKEHHRSKVPALIAFAIASLCILAAPVAVFILHLV